MIGSGRRAGVCDVKCGGIAFFEALSRNLEREYCQGQSSARSGSGCATSFRGKNSSSTTRSAATAAAVLLLGVETSFLLGVAGLRRSRPEQVKAKTHASRQSRNLNFDHPKALASYNGEQEKKITRRARSKSLHLQLTSIGSGRGTPSERGDEAESFLAAPTLDGSAEMLVLVHSAREHAAARQAIRETWLKPTRPMTGKKLAVTSASPWASYFTVGEQGCEIPVAARVVHSVKAPGANCTLDADRASNIGGAAFAEQTEKECQLTEALHEEARAFGDVVLLPVVDVYFNATEKWKAAFHWVASQEFSSGVKWVMGIDDDSYARPAMLHQFLFPSPSEQVPTVGLDPRKEKLIIGSLYDGAKVQKNPQEDKHPELNYPRDTYPTFAGGAHGVAFSWNFVKYVADHDAELFPYSAGDYCWGVYAAEGKIPGVRFINGNDGGERFRKDGNCTRPDMLSVSSFTPDQIRACAAVDAQLNSGPPGGSAFFLKLAAVTVSKKPQITNGFKKKREEAEAEEQRQDGRQAEVATNSTSFLCVSGVCHALSLWTGSAYPQLPPSFLKLATPKPEFFRTLEKYWDNFMDPGVWVVPNGFVNFRLGETEIELLWPNHLLSWTRVDKDTPAISADGMGMTLCLAEQVSRVLRSSSWPFLLRTVGPHWLDTEPSHRGLHNRMEAFASEMLSDPTWRHTAEGARASGHWSPWGFYMLPPGAEDQHLPADEGGFPGYEVVRKMMEQARRPLVLIGPPHLSAVSCRFFPTRVAFLEAPRREENDACDGPTKKRLKKAMAEQCERFPSETVIFLFAGGSFMKVIAAEAFAESPACLQRKDVALDIGGSLDPAAGGVAGGSYANDVKRICQDFFLAMSCEDCNLHCKGMCSQCIPATDTRGDCTEIAPGGSETANGGEAFLSPR
ncbi:unnamed protein product [Amoebophrya sp. A120]|nr:unnamed protein product [Amoebophrya sp. A120]|eukprot:GSA120T00015143001.1